MVPSEKGNIAICAVCQRSSKLKCSNCYQTYYCNEKHQKYDWKNHKRQCFPFIENYNDRLGRHLIASRNIKAAEVVLQESPLVCGPSQISRPVCVGCLKGINQQDYLECERCGWPVCQRICQEAKEHAAECSLTAARGYKINIKNFADSDPFYQCLTPLRCLLLKKTSPEQWKKLIKLESHENLRFGSDQWRRDQDGIANFIPKLFKCSSWSTNEILKISGILQINGHEVPLSETPYVAIYDNASFLEHSCRPNLAKSFSNNGDILIWAPYPIQKGTSLSICYTDALWGFANRRHHLLETKMFECKCIRCEDITESGTFFNALLCDRKDCRGPVLPESSDKWDAEWRCRNCNKIIDHESTIRIFFKAGKDLATMDKTNIKICERYMDHYSLLLYGNNHYLVEATLALIQLLGSGEGLSQSLSEEYLDKKIFLCEKLLKIVNSVSPAEMRVLGIIHFELHAALAEKSRRLLPKDVKLSRLTLLESLQNVEYSVRFLQHEPSILSEGQICKQAEINLHYLKSIEIK